MTGWEVLRTASKFMRKLEAVIYCQFQNHVHFNDILPHIIFHIIAVNNTPHVHYWQQYMRIILGTYFIIITIIIIIVYSTWSKNRTFSKVYFDFKDKKQNSLLLIIITNNKVTARMKQPPFTSVAKVGLKKYRIN